MNWHSDGNRLMIDDNVVETFPFPIMECKAYGDWLVIVLQPLRGNPCPNNVFGYNMNTGRKWQVEFYKGAVASSPSAFFTGSGRNNIGPGELNLGTWPGVNVIVDITTGSVIGTRDSR